MINTSMVNYTYNAISMTEGNLIKDPKAIAV